MSLQNQRDVNYRLLNSQTMFEIDADTGRVTTRIPLNLGSYPLQIEVSDVSTTLVCMRTVPMICVYFIWNLIIFSNNCKYIDFISDFPWCQKYD